MTEWASFSSLLGRSSEEGIPDNHVVTVTERSLSVDIPELIQNNIKTDTVTLVLDAEWEGISPVIIFECSDADYQVQYEGSPAHIPQAVMKSTGSVGLSICGYDDTGEIRLVTKAAPSTFTVVASGSFIGEISEDDVSLLGQILAAAEAANEAAQKVADASFSMGAVTTLEPGEQASASLDGEGLQKTLNLSIPKGAKGDKGDKGDDGDKGDKGDDGDKGDQGDPGTAATIAVGSVTGLDAGASPTVVNSGTANAAIFDFGIPKGDKGDQGDPGRTPQRGVDYWTAEDVEAVVEDAKAQAVAELAEIGNVPKRTVSDLVAHGEDAYAQKPLEVRVKGKTWVNRLPRFTTANGNNGKITVSMAENGLITLNAPADTSGGSDNRFYISLSDNIIFTPNKPMTLLVSSGNISTVIDADWYLFIAAYDEEDRRIRPYEIRNEASMTTAVTPSNTGHLNVSIAVKSGVTVNASFRVMLVEGAEAPDCFTPPASITSVQAGNLVTAGKNLLPKLALAAPSSSGMTATLNDDKSITLNGTATSRATFALSGAAPYTDVIGEFVPGTYTLSVGSEAAGILFDIMDWREQKGIITVGKNYSSSNTKTLSNITEYTYIRIQIDEGTTLNKVTIYPQLELGSTATSYEPPSITTTPLPEVELRSLPDGTCDELVIGADGTCRVERNVTEYEVQGTETIRVGEHSNGQKYATVTGIAFISSSSSSSLLSDRYSCGVYGTIDKYAYVPNAKDLVINDSRFTDNETAKSILASEKPRFVFVVNQTTEPQSPVTLPALPAPTFNAYHDGDVPSDTSVEYARDINLVLANLEAVQAALLGGE